MPQTVKQLVFEIPIKVISEANARDHWRVKNARKKAQQEETMVAMHNALRGRTIDLPCTVKLTRVGAKTLDTDNLSGSFKGVRDCIAFKMSVDDGDVDKIQFEYDQVAIGIREYSVKVEITTKESQ